MFALRLFVRSRIKGNKTSPDEPVSTFFPANRLSDSPTDQSYHSHDYSHELPASEQMKQLTAARSKTIFIASAIYMISVIFLVLVCCLERRSGYARFLPLQRQFAILILCGLTVE